jgi:hypothetical protein
MRHQAPYFGVVRTEIARGVQSFEASIILLQSRIESIAKSELNLLKLI